MLDARRALGPLHAVDPIEIEGDGARLAFWINVYNALVHHELCRRPRSGNLLLHRRLAALPSEVDARIHFALNCGARSCPAIRSYGADEIERQLELATRSYVSEETRVDRTAGRVTLPKLLRIYRADFGPKDAQLEFVASRLEAEDAAWVRDNRDGLRVGYGSYDWTITLDA